MLWLAGLGCHLQHQHTVSECSPAATRSTASGEAAEDGLSSWRPVFLVGNRTEVQTFGFYLAYLQTCGYLGSELENGFFSVSFCNLKKKKYFERLWLTLSNELAIECGQITCKSQKRFRSTALIPHPSFSP